jgi:hypothetical protein
MKAPSIIISLAFAVVIGYLYGQPHDKPCTAPAHTAPVVLSVDFKVETLEDLERKQWAETRFCYANPGKAFDDSGTRGICTPLDPAHGFVDIIGWNDPRQQLFYAK